MNKSLIVLPFILGMFMALSLNAQLGIKAGINLANLSYDPESSIYSTTVKPGISVGAFYNLRLSDRFALQPEVDYIQHGAKTEYTLGNTTSKSNSSYTINYLQIPVLLKMRLVNSLYAQAGPYVGKGLGKAKMNSQTQTAIKQYWNQSLQRMELMVQKSGIMVFR